MVKSLVVLTQCNSSSVVYILYQALLPQVSPGFLVGSEVPKCNAAL